MAEPFYFNGQDIYSTQLSAKSRAAARRTVDVPRWKENIPQLAPGDILAGDGGNAYIYNGDKFEVFDPVVRDSDHQALAKRSAQFTDTPHMWNVRSTGQNGAFVMPRVMVEAESPNFLEKAGDWWYKNVIPTTYEGNNVAIKVLNPPYRDIAGGIVGLAVGGGAAASAKSGAAASAKSLGSLGGRVIATAAKILGIGFAAQAASKLVYNISPYSDDKLYEVDANVFNGMVDQKIPIRKADIDTWISGGQAREITAANIGEAIPKGKIRFKYSGNFDWQGIANPMDWKSGLFPGNPVYKLNDFKAAVPDSIPRPSGGNKKRPPVSVQPAAQRQQQPSNTTTGNSDNTAEPFTGEAGARTSNETRPIVTDPSE